VKTLFQNPVIGALSSLRLAAGLLIVFGAAIGIATFVEARWGRDGAYEMVYAARWFEAVLALLVVNLTLSLFRRAPYRARNLGSMLLHISMIIILVAAGITRYFGYEGSMHIREGQSADFISSSRDYVQAFRGEETGSFAQRLYRPGEQNHARNVTLGGTSYKVGVSEYWPHYEEQWVPGQNGIAALNYTTRVEGATANETLYEDSRGTFGDVPVTFTREPLVARPATSRYGDLRVRAGGEVCTFAVQRGTGVLGICGGWRFEQVEFHPDFKVGSGPADPDGPLINPMVKLAITSPDGKKGERRLFALHPEFAMNHPGMDAAFTQLDLLYNIDSGVEIGRGPAGGLVMRAPFPVTVSDMSGTGSREIPAGEVFPLREKVLYGNEAAGLRLVPSAIETSLVRSAGASDNPNAPAAARLFVECGEERAEAVVMTGADPADVTVCGETISLAYGPIVMPVPYTLTLEDFVLETYPGSDNPASYESFLTLTDARAGIQDQPVHIWMNNPLNHGGSKHFQSSYDQDRKGTILTVNHDPGKWPTYFGYGLLTLGFLLILLRELFWHQPDAGPAASKKARGGAAVVVLALCSSLLAANPATAQDAGQDPGAMRPDGSGHVVLSDRARAEAAQLIVQDFQGRMKPLDTLAREMSMKVAKSTRFEGRDPLDMLLAFAVQPTYWWNHPVIAVRNPGVKKLIGVGPDVKHVSAASLFENETYKLEAQVEEAHRTPARDRTKTQQQLISFDERLHMLYLSLQGNTLRLYPVPGDPNHTWLGIEEVAERLTPEQKAEYDAAFAGLFGGLQSGDQTRVLEGIRLTRDLQRKYGADALPRGPAVKAELALNRLQPFVWSTLPYLGGFAVLMVAFFVSLLKHDGRPWAWRHPLYLTGMLLFVAGLSLHTYGYVLRWIASGRAPLSNGHESLLFIALAVGAAGLIFELSSRQAAAASLGALLTAVILGISMMGTFDPAIGPLVPVLASYWLNIHVTVITASYGFLGLSALLGVLTMVLFMIEATRRRDFGPAVVKLDRLNIAVMTTGLGLLAIGTYLGGIWANESWGRYWGWDAKETWALVSILVYAVILHFRWIPALRSPFVQAACSLVAISSVVMTYFGVNYFLSGLHSYAAGEAGKVPVWVHLGWLIMLIFVAVSYVAWRSREAHSKGGSAIKAAGRPR
jgi:cytochrome c-type biogenesis protein CcsB